MRRLSKLNAIVCAMIFAAAISASAKQGETRKTTVGGQAVRGDLVIGLEPDLKNNSLRGHIAGAENCNTDGHQKLEVTAPSDADETSAQYLAKTPVV